MSIRHETQRQNFTINILAYFSSVMLTANFLLALLAKLYVTSSDTCPVFMITSDFCSACGVHVIVDMYGTRRRLCVVCLWNFYLL